MDSDLHDHSLVPVLLHQTPVSITEVTAGPKLFSCYECDAEVGTVRVAVRVVGTRVVRLCSNCQLSEEELCAPLPSSICFTDLSDCVPSALRSTKGEEPPPEECLKVAADVESETDSTDTVAEIGGGAVAAVALVESTLPIWKRGLKSHRLRWATALALVLVAGLPVVAFALSGNTESREWSSDEAPVEPVTAPPPSVERPQSKLLSIYSDEIEMVVDPAEEELVDGDSWVHPVAGTEEQVPTKRTRLFKAERPGQRASECGLGHCGVDLGSPRGTPIVAVRPGIVIKTMRDKSASGGLYVWIEHEDVGIRTEYFHLDKVADGLEAGDSVAAGEWLGTLGRTGIENSTPHLHFAVRDLNENLLYMNPMPWLEDARIIDVLDIQVMVEEQ